jgi:hypothetical protein
LISAKTFRIYHSRAEEFPFKKSQEPEGIKSMKKEGNCEVFLFLD